MLIMLYSVIAKFPNLNCIQDVRKDLQTVIRIIGTDNKQLEYVIVNEVIK